MQTKSTQDTITITASLDELWQWQQQDLRIYATPPTEDDIRAGQVYVDSRPQYMYDFVFATVEDFCEAEGWDHIDDPDKPRDWFSGLTEEEKAFAVACYEDNSIDELAAPHAATDADATDMATWGLSPSAWSAAVEAAYRQRVANDQAAQETVEITLPRARRQLDDAI